MTDKSNFRAEKNERIEARDKALNEAKAKQRKKEKSELDDPAHWRFRKNQGIKHGTTTMKDIKGKEEPPKEEPPKEVPPNPVQPKEEPPKEEGTKEPKDVIFTEASAKALNRKEQLAILKARDKKAYGFDKEAVLVQKIIESNPKE